MDYLIYHPNRKVSIIGNFTVYHDKFGSNKDPFLWNYQFLHTSCHITQMRNEVGQMNFWVSGNQYPNFTKLYCDCVFVIAEKLTWAKRNSIDLDDEIVDNEQAFEHHYDWVNNLKPDDHHYFKKRNRYTLKADPEQSFQPQNKDSKLIDIVPFLKNHGVSIDQLRLVMISNVNSRPFKLPDDIGEELYDYLFNLAAIKLKGNQLASIHPHRISSRQSKPQAKCC